MVKRNAVFLVIVSVILGLSAAWLANNWITSQMVPMANASTHNTVVVAALEIPMGRKIEGSHIKVISLPKEAEPKGAFHQVSEVEGMTATQQMYPGEILIRERVAEHQTGSTLASIVTPTKRAVTVRVNDVIGVGGFLLPGNHVDVVASRKVDRRAVAETVLQNVKVLAVDQMASTNKDDPVIVRAVTLEVGSREAEILVRSTQEGTVQLALRNPTDQTQAEAQQEPAPVKSVVWRAPSIMVIRGTSVGAAKL